MSLDAAARLVPEPGKGIGWTQTTTRATRRRTYVTTTSVDVKLWEVGVLGAVGVAFLVLTGGVIPDWPKFEWPKLPIVPWPLP